MALHAVRNLPLHRRRSRIERFRRRTGAAFVAFYTGVRLMRLLGRLWRG